MSEKVRNYEKESIEVCRNCKGTGIALHGTGVSPIRERG